MDTHSDEPVFVFVYYVSRSGSTFLLNELSKINGVLTCPEGDILVDVFLERKKINSPINNSEWKKISATLSNNEKLKLWRIDLAKLGEQIIGQNPINAFFQVLRNYSLIDNISYDYIVFKNTKLLNSNVLSNELIRNKNVKIISIIRDCRGVYASQKRFRLFPSGHEMANNPITVSFKWKNHYRNSMKQIQNDFFLMFMYEDLIDKFELTIKYIHEFLGIEVKINDILPKGNQISKIPAEQIQFHNKIGSTPNHESINLWQKELSIQEIGIIDLLNKKELKNLGYFMTSRKVSLNITFMIFLLRHLKYSMKKLFLKLC